MDLVKGLYDRDVMRPMRLRHTLWTLPALAAGFIACTDELGPTQLPAALRVTTATPGPAPDRDGYTVCVDPASDSQGGTSCLETGPLAIGVNGTGTVTVDTGAHTVLLMGVAAHCAVAGDNPRFVHASRGERAEVHFAIECASVPLHITTTTIGVSLDPDGYSLCIDPRPSPWDFDDVCTYALAVGVNGDVTLSVALGTHAVRLDSVAHNCAVGGDNPRSVDASAPTEAQFEITCVQSLPLGSLPAWRPDP